ncbi:copper(I)-binding protein [Streptomyces olivoverticillatus]|uniref:Copper(I)-binding protein n=1 Tax=Streptomyces olivoverticillatus TaxID=66427 RepID=A0A7W7LLP3_9ACTN|nr:copper(I)-binding protein [Streptomyces olivoverticillatus]
MSSSLRRGALAASVLVLSIASLSACAAGNSAQTLEVKPDNAATSVGDIKLQNVNVITQPDQKTNGPAVITGRLFNNGNTDQTLRGISLPGKDSPVKLSAAKGGGQIVVPAHSSLTLGGKDNASAVLPKGREGLKDGDSQPLVFDFSSTGQVKISAFVYPATSYFSEWGPSAPASPAAPASSPAAPQGSPSAPAAPAGSASPSAQQSRPAASESAKAGQQHAGH